MKKIFTFNLLKYIIVSVIALGSFSQVKATHLQGGNLGYTFLGKQANGKYNYEITFTFFLNCDSTSGINKSSYPNIYDVPPPEFGIYSTTGSEQELYDITFPPVKSVKDIPKGTSAGCTIITNVCSQEGIYDTIVSLDSNGTGYYIYMQQFARNNNIANLQDPADDGISFYAFIPPTHIHNTTPVISNPSTAYLCYGQINSFLSAAVDPDGDQLVYSFVWPYDSHDKVTSPPPPANFPQPIPLVAYGGGYSLAQPFGAGGIATIDSLTGVCQFQCNNQGLFVVAIQVKEIRGGVVIDSIRSDMLIDFIDCSLLTGGGGHTNEAPDTLGSLTTAYSLIAGDSLCFNTPFVDHDGNDSSFINLICHPSGINIFNSAAINPPAIFHDTTGLGNTTLSQQFCWYTNCKDTSSHPYSFYVTATDSGKYQCPPRSTIVSFDIKVSPLKVKLASHTVRFCSGDTVMIGDTAPHHGATYKWFPLNGSDNINNILNTNISWTKVTSFSGTLAQGDSLVLKYILTGQYAGCAKSQDTVTVIVYPYPSANAGTSKSVCTNDTIKIGPASFSFYSYSWSPTTYLFPNPNQANPNFSESGVIIPLQNKYYLNTGFHGCVTRDSIVVTVNPLPIVTATASPDSVCPNDTSILTGYGAKSYLWLLTVGTTLVVDSANPIKVNPAHTTTYPLFGTDVNGCKNNTNIKVTTRLLPVVKASPHDTTICSRDTISLMAHGAVTYNWIPFKTTPATDTSSKNTITIHNLLNPPNAIDSFALQGTDKFGCINTDTAIIHVNKLPPVLATAKPDTICSGDTAKIKATGALTYIWNYLGYHSTISTSDSIMPDSMIAVGSPAHLYRYVLIGTDVNHCINRDTASVLVHSLPSINTSVSRDTICSGDPVFLDAFNAKYYWWAQSTHPLVDISNLQFTEVSPTTSSPAFAKYIVYATDSNGCKNKDSAEVFVHPLPHIVPMETNTGVCQGDTTSITVSGALSYNWRYNWNPDSIISISNDTIILADTTTHILVIGTDIYGCINNAVLNFSVNPKPTGDSIVGSPYVCPGSTILYFVRPYSTLFTYNWSTQSLSQPQIKNYSISDFLDTATISWQNITGPDTVPFNATFTNKATGCTSDTFYYKVVVTSKFEPPVPVGNSIICLNSASADSFTYHVKYFTPGNHYQFGIIGGTLIGKTDTDIVTVKWNNAAGNYKLWFTEGVITGAGLNSDTCFGTSDTLLVQIISNPPIKPIMGKSSFCIGSVSLQGYYIANTAGSSFKWIEKGGQFIGDSTLNAINIQWKDTITGTDSLYVQETNEYGCMGLENSLRIAINALPVVNAVKGDSLICPTNLESNLYFVPFPTVGNTYIWTVHGGTIASSSKNGADSIYVDWGQDSVYNVSASAISIDSCVGPNSPVFPVTVDRIDVKLKLVSNDLLNGKNIDVSWELINGGYFNGNYLLYKRVYQSGEPWQFMGTITAAVYVDTNQNTQNTIYEYLVKVFNKCDNMVSSEPQNSVVLKATNDEVSKQAWLNWNPYNNFLKGLNHYEVWRQLDSQQDTLYQTYNANDTSAHYVNGTDGFNQCYRVLSVENGSENQSWSNQACVVFKNVLEIPSAFSPNADGVNDTWVIKNLTAYPNTSVEIFNRWGSKVFSSLSYQNDWDGGNLPDGTYFYVIILNNISANNKQDKFIGPVTIIR